MEFFPEVHLSHGAAEAIARGLYADRARRRGARARGGPDRVVLDRRRRRRAAERSRARASRSSRPTLAAALHSDAERQLFIKTAILLDVGRRLGVAGREEGGRATSPRRSASTTRRWRSSTRSVKDFLLGQLVHVQNSDAVSSVAKKLKV